MLGATVVSLMVLAPLCVQAIQGRAAPGSDAPSAASAMGSPTVRITRVGSTVEWMEKVSDEQYRAGSSAE
jgi:hypothetical protein